MIDTKRLLDTFLDLVPIDNPSGAEGALANRVMAELRAMGLNPIQDTIGNVITVVPGTGEPFLLNAHLDSVPPCSGVVPVIRDGTVHSDGTTVLGADDKAGIAVALEVVRALGHDETRRPSLEVVFTVGEEVGLVGSRALDYSSLRAKEGVAIDSAGPAGQLWTSAPAINELSVTIHGRAAHAGVSPEAGISAIVAASTAIAGMKLGRIDDETSANIGTIAGGAARNVVPPEVHIEGEARSRDAAKLEAQTRHMVETFERSAAAIGAKADIVVNQTLKSFRLPDDDPLVQAFSAAARSIGLEPTTHASGGGFDCNVFNQHGIKSISLSVGYEDLHTTAEYLVIEEMNRAAAILLAFLRAR